MPAPDPDPPTEPQRTYTCPECHNEIGPLFERPDFPVALLSVGGMVCTDARGLCKRCGTVINFHVNTKMLQRLLNRSGVEITEKELNG